MTNPNPFVPKGSLLDNQSRRRSRLKLAVFCVLAVSVTGLTAMLIQGCKRTAPDTEIVPPPVETNAFPPLDTNFPPMNAVSNPPVTVPPVTAPVGNPVVVPPVAPPEPVAPAAGGDYTIVKGDSLAKIAKAHGVSVKALQAANPGVVPTRMKIGQKLVIPAGGSAGGSVAPTAASGEVSGTTVYTVKSGDNLTRIAKKHGTSIKAIQAANNLPTTRIHVGQKLKIPSKAEAPPAMPATAPAPAPVTEPAPALPPVPAPARVPGQ